MVMRLVAVTILATHQQQQTTCWIRSVDNGRNLIACIRSHLNQGPLGVVAETEPVGEETRWLGNTRNRTDLKTRWMYSLLG